MQEGQITQIEGLINIEHRLPVESEYRKSLVALNRTGVLSILPQSERLGVIGADGKEYPVPTLEEVHGIFEHNRKLVEAKRAEGFTRLQITPLAMSVSLLIDRAKEAILKHNREGKIFQTKRNADDSEIVVSVDTDEPVWVWDTVKEAVASDKVVYFPRQFDVNHDGKSKDRIIADPKICAIPGWSIGLVEDNKFLPVQGSGQIIGGRKQLENNSTPRDYVKSLQSGIYKGETGWTYEDILTDFLVNLENTNEVSHEWRENNGLWLVGSYLPESANVPDSRWDRGGGQLRVDASGPGFQNEYLGVRSTVRLGV
ncbi:MAG TPA: hypothetical protein VF185_04735 [Patescibacteria group bacterium]